MPEDALSLRPVRDADRDGLIELIGGVYAEYPGCVLDLPGLDVDLQQPATHAASTGTALWVVDDGGVIVGSIGLGPPRNAEVELKRLYVAKPHRGRGIATRLVRHVEQVAVTRRADRIELWSDTRFADAHRLYRRLGYERTGEQRHLDDPSDTTEWRFRRELRGSRVG